MFSFGSMSPFFHDEYLFNDDERQRRRRNEDDGYCWMPCPDCGSPLKFRYEAERVRCRQCGSKFNVSEKVR